MTKRLTLGQFQRVVAALEPKTQAAAVRGFRRAGAFLLRTVVVEIGQASPRAAVDTGELRSSADIEIVADGSIVSVDAPHAWIMEYGRRPGGRMPPIQPIADWMRRKRLIPKEMLGELRKRARKRAIREATPIVGKAYARRAVRAAGAEIEDAIYRQAAFAMARKIARDGIEPRHYFRKAWDRSVPIMVRMVNLEMAKVGWRVTPAGIRKMESSFREAAK